MLHNEKRRRGVGTISLDRISNTRRDARRANYPTCANRLSPPTCPYPYTPPPPLPPAARKFRHSGPARLLQREEQSRGRKNAAVTAYARGYRDDNSRGSASKLHTRLRGAPGFRLRREHPLDLQLELNDATPRAGP